MLEECLAFRNERAVTVVGISVSDPQALAKLAQVQGEIRGMDLLLQVMADIAREPDNEGT